MGNIYTMFHNIIEGPVKNNIKGPECTAKYNWNLNGLIQDSLLI